MSGITDLKMALILPAFLIAGVSGNADISGGFIESLGNTIRARQEVKALAVHNENEATYRVGTNIESAQDIPPPVASKKARPV